MLVHPSSHSILEECYSLDPMTSSSSPTRLSLSLARHSSRLQSLLKDTRIESGIPHIYSILLWSIRFVLPGFRSPLLAGSQLVSLPAATKMFQFTAYLSIPGRTDISGSQLACSYPELIAACHVRLKCEPGNPLSGFSLHVNALTQTYISVTAFAQLRQPKHLDGRKVDSARY